MKNIVKKTAIAASVASALSFSGSALAAFPTDMFIDIGDERYGDACGTAGLCSGEPDGDAATGVFNEFGFIAFLATSVYAYDDTSVFGAFFDSNRTGDIVGGSGIDDMPFVPSSGTALDGMTPVSLDVPLDPAQVDIDNLSPLVPPFFNDNEGFNTQWELVAEYVLTGDLDPLGGPNYTGGQIDIIWRETALGDMNTDMNGIDSFLALTLDVQFSNIAIDAGSGVGALEIFYEVSFAEDDFLWIDDGTGTFVDVADLIAAGLTVQARQDNDVDPAFPTPDQLLLVSGPVSPELQALGYTDDDYVARQTTLDGTVSFMVVPEPGSLLLFGAGLLGLGRAARRRK